MLLALSTAAAPSASLSELAEYAARRGLAGVHVESERDAVLDASRENVDEAAARLFGERPDIQHITLRGGGPEAAQFAGRGIGALMTRLALMNYQGVLALAPSSKAVLPVWQTWLAQRRSWGCGSKTSDPSLFQLK